MSYEKNIEINLNYAKDVEIDCDQLDLELLEQAALFMKYGMNAARQRKYLDIVKEKLDLVKAELDQKIRTFPSNYKIDKVTEAVVSSTIIQQDEFKEANKEYIEAKYTLDVAQVAVSAMNQRKSVLEDLVKLHGMQYFAGPRIPRDLRQKREEREAQQKETGEKVGASLKRKTR
jgi:hypothetical protein